MATSSCHSRSPRHYRPKRHSRKGGNLPDLITDNLDIWSSAIKTKSSAGRGSSNKRELYGIVKLRELILELAIRGLLVSQDPNDEPASVLLEKITAEKAKLVKEGKLKKQKSQPPISGSEKPFELPRGWEWTMLKDVCVLENGDRSKNYPNKSLLVDSGIPFVNAGQLQNGRISKEDMTFITEDRYNLLKAGKFSDGDILFCLRGSLGKSAIVEGLDRGAIASSLVIVRLFKQLNRYYFHNYFDSPFSYRMIKLYDNGTAQPNLSASDLGKFLVPLPPLEEQHRIVAKVDELMTLCDQLEQQQENSLKAHQTLVQTLLSALTTASEKGMFNEAWARIAENFDILFTTEGSIDQLKQTILQLAVMGKLVPQNPNEEQASKLLKKIAAEKAKLVKAGKIKKQKPLPPINEDEKPFELPEGWEWVRIGDATLFSEYGVSAKTYENIGGIPVLKMGDIQQGRVLLGGQKETFPDFEGISELMLKHGDILYNRTNSAELVGKTGRFDGPDDQYSFASYLIRIRCHENSLTSEFLNLYMNSPLFRKTQIEPHLKQQCGQANVNGTIMKRMLASIPPHKEQRRIVAKVDELMALCENLKSRINAAQTTQLHLADAMAEQAIP